MEFQIWVRCSHPHVFPPFLSLAIHHLFHAASSFLAAPTAGRCMPPAHLSNNTCVTRYMCHTCHMRHMSHASHVTLPLTVDSPRIQSCISGAGEDAMLPREVLRWQLCCLPLRCCHVHRLKLFTAAAICASSRGSFAAATACSWRRAGCVCSMTSDVSSCDVSQATHPILNAASLVVRPRPSARFM